VANGGRLVAAVATIVNLVAPICQPDAQVIGALEAALGTVAAARIPGRTIQLIGQIRTVLVAVAAQLLLDAVARAALELVRWAVVRGTLLLVGAVAAIVVLVALPAGRNAFVVVAAELGLRALAIAAAAHGLVFIGVVAAVVLKVAEPALGDAALVAALEVALVRAFRAVFGELVRAVATIILDKK
jgi:hypothetical protein